MPDCECPVSGFNPKTGKDWDRPICGQTPAARCPAGVRLWLCADHWVLGFPPRNEIMPPFPVRS